MRTLSFLVLVPFQVAEKLKGQETVDRPCPEEEGDLDSDIAPFVCLPWGEVEIFFF